MKALLLAAMLLTAASANAQDDPEYRMETGAGVGLMAYQGDYSGSLTRNMQPMASAIARYKPNPRMAWCLSLSYGNIKGSYDQGTTYYPELNDANRTFKNGVFDAGVRYEYNFWPYGTGHDYRGAKRLTPFIAVGVGMTFANTPWGSVVATNFPIGGGIRYKVAERLNLTVEWMMHFTTSDRIDGVNDPYGIKSSGMFKNKDSYSMLQIGVSYDIWAKCRTCHNDE